MVAASPDRFPNRSVKLEGNKKVAKEKKKGKGILLSRVGKRNTTRTSKSLSEGQPSDSKEAKQLIFAGDPSME